MEGIKPLKVVDANRDIRHGITASSLEELVRRVRVKFDIELESEIRIVLESDGTEIDDNDYFHTLEENTQLMILCNNERWCPYKSILTLGIALEPRENGDCCGGGGGTSSSSSGSPVEELVWRLRQDLSFFPWITHKELEQIVKMDTDEMRKICPDQKFLEFLQDLAERYLKDKEKCKEDPATNTILEDPLRLIKMYSKSKHYLYTNGSHERLIYTNSNDHINSTHRDDERF